MTLCADMENVTSVPSAAPVRFQGWGKFLALNILYYVVNALSVAILRFFNVNCVDSVRCYRNKSGKNTKIEILFICCCCFTKIWVWCNLHAFL